MVNYNNESAWSSIGYKELIIRHLDRLSILTSRVFSDYGEESTSSASEDSRVNGMAWGVEFLMSILPKEIYEKVSFPAKKNGEEDYVYLCKKIREIMNFCDFIYTDEDAPVMIASDGDEI